MCWQHVDVVGYPMGGDGISITSGVVSRVDWGSYTHGRRHNLVVTVDAAINPGNSGGPALSGGKVAGVAFQGMVSADNIGYIVPVAVLRIVLRDFDEASAAAAATSGVAALSAGTIVTKPLALRGFADFAPTLQTCENREIRRAAGLPDGTSGVLVREIPRLSKLRGLLHEGDVLVAVDGEPVSNDGRIKFGEGSPIDFRVKVRSIL
jgi:S1-C subfamily serine protease